MPDLLKDLLVIIGIAVAVASAAHRIRIPPILGFLLTGVIAGPHGFRLVGHVDEVQHLAEIGVNLLLFTIGLEFSFRHLVKIGWIAGVGGGVQVLATVGVTAGAAHLYGYGARTAIFLGFLVALSSTALVLRILQERKETGTPAGRVAIGILIAQDLLVVPMILAVPFLAGEGGDPARAAVNVGIRAAIVIGVVFAGARWIVPALLDRVTRTESRELFLLSILLVCAAVVGLSAYLGLSLALGAFLAGMMVAGTQYSHQAFGNVIPFRDVFTSFFFISVGMLLDPASIVAEPGLLLGCALAVIVVKTLCAGLAAMTLGFPWRISARAGLSLGQVGEFSFVLAGAGALAGLLDPGTNGKFLTVAVLTMAVTPLLMRIPIPARYRGRRPWADRADQEVAAGIRDHLVIVGFGFAGSHIASAARAAGIEYRIIEMNPATVRRERAAGQPILYGDAAEEVILESASARSARAAVIAISDAKATSMTVRALRRVNPGIHIIARTRYFEEVAELKRIGANEVVPEEFETSIEIFSRVLHRFLVPRDVVRSIADEVRREGFESLGHEPILDRTFDLARRTLPGIEIEAVRIAPESTVVGWTLAEADLRRVHAVTLLAIRRDQAVIDNPAGSEVLAAGDILYIMGRIDAIHDVLPLFE